MIGDPIVSNASPLIALNQIGRLAVLPRLFTTIAIPPAVRREIAPSVGLPGWITERQLARPVDRRIPGVLGAGEREAVSLALEFGASQIILDDLRARRVAESLGLTVIGTLGILVLAKRQGLIDVVRPHIEMLLEQGFFASPGVVSDALTTAGEM